MITIFGSGIIGLFIAHKLLSEGEDVKKLLILIIIEGIQLMPQLEC